MVIAAPIISASVPTLSTTGVNMGIDVDITITAGDRGWSGGVTLVHSDSDGEWGSWGAPDHWCSSELLDAAGELGACELSRSAVLTEILGAAQSSIESDPDIGEALDREAERLEEKREADEAQADFASPYGDPLERPAY